MLPQMWPCAKRSGREFAGLVSQAGEVVAVLSN